MSLTYSSYLQLERLLSAQVPHSDPEEHDEMLFIVIHQVYELWFKQLLHETDHLVARLDADDLPAVHATLKRFLTILKVQVAQIDILETMTPVSFLSFRNRLEAASGFQSPQFRALEFRLGVRDRRMLRYHEGTPAHDELARRLDQPSLWDAFTGFLGRNGVEVPRSLRDRDLSQANPETPALHPALVGIRRRRRSIRRSSGSTATAPTWRRSASAWSTSTRGSRSGATGTSRWSSARSARRAAREARPAPPICAPPSSARSFPISGRSVRSSERCRRSAS